MKYEIGNMQCDINMKYLCKMKSGPESEWNHTVAAQHTRTSYRCPSFNPSSRYHDETPFCASAVGNSARICLRRVWWSGVRDGRCRSESVGWESGMLRAEGARKMAFSVLAWTDERWVVRRRSVERLGSW